MIFHVLVIDEGAAQAGSMFPGGARPPPPPLDPLQPLSPPPPATGAATAQEFHRVCTTANLATCAPVCDELTYGYLLSIEIDGRGTVMTCNKVDGIFSWQGQASLGGYIGDDFSSFFSSVSSGAAGTYMGTLSADAGMSTDLTIRPGQTVLVTGDPLLAVAPSWGSGRFEVQQGGAVSLAFVRLSAAVYVSTGGSAGLSDCNLEASVELVVSGLLTLTAMAVPEAVLVAAEDQLSGSGSMLRLVGVTSVGAEWELRDLTGMIVVAADGTKALDPPNSLPGFYVVNSGPCTVSESGRCVGRPAGYGANEQCAISVGGGGGRLDACGVFDMYIVGTDAVTLPDGTRCDHSDCPEGMVLAPGDAVSWQSDAANQGSVGCGGCENGCTAKGICGLPWSGCGDDTCPPLGGGWQICFEDGGRVVAPVSHVIITPPPPPPPDNWCPSCCCSTWCPAMGFIANPRCATAGYLCGTAGDCLGYHDGSPDPRMDGGTCDNTC